MSPLKLMRNNSDENTDRLIDKALGKPRDAAKIAREILQDAFDSAGLATAADLANIKERIKQIEKNIKKMKASEGKSEKKKAEIE